MNFEEELKDILDRYVQLGDNKEQHKNAVKIFINQNNGLI